MALPSSEAFARLFRDLDRAERLAFVVDLWTARGWETTVENGVIVAADGEHRQRIRIVDPGRFGTALPDDIDVVVPLRERESRRAAAERAGIRYIPPSELRQLLLYGVDRGTAAALFEETFGHSLDAQTHVASPLSQRIRRVAGDVVGPMQGRPVGSRVTLTVLLVAMLLGVAVAGPALSPTSEETPLVVETSTIVPNGAETSDGASDVGSVGAAEPALPPGLVESGISDRSALVEAHQTVVQNRRRTLSVAADGPANATFMSGRIAWNYTVRAERSTHYLYDATHTYPADPATASPDTVRTSTFSQGGVIYRRQVSGTQTSYLRYPMDADDDASTFTTEVNRFLRTYLRGQQSAVDCVGDAPDRDAHCGIILSGAPPSFPTAQGYRVSASIRPSGLVTSFSVSYTLPDTDGDGRRELVRFGFEYEALDTTTVSEPAWLPEAKNATAESSSA